MLSSQTPKIPRVFHFVFGLKAQRESFHLVFYLCLRSCIKVNQPDQVIFYYHHEPYGRYWDLIKPELTLVKVPLVSGLETRYGDDNASMPYSYAHHSDFIRVEKVLEQGGVYADMDTLFVRPIPPSLYAESFVMGREPDVFCEKRQEVRPSLCNAFFMAEKGSPFARAWLRNMSDYFDGTWSNHSCYLPYYLSTQHPEWIKVVDQEMCFHFIYEGDALRDLFERNSVVPDGLCSIHLWNHLWWDKARRDFSDFHGGLITESNIRAVDTTFNCLARNHLPAHSPVRAVNAWYWLKDCYWRAHNMGRHWLPRVLRRLGLR